MQFGITKRQLKSFKLIFSERKEIIKYDKVTGSSPPSVKVFPYAQNAHSSSADPATFV